MAAAKEATMAAMKYLKDMKTTVTMGAIRDRNPEGDMILELSV